MPGQWDRAEGAGPWHLWLRRTHGRVWQGEGPHSQCVRGSVSQGTWLLDDGQLADSFRDGSWLLESRKAVRQWHSGAWINPLALALVGACFFLLSESNSARNLPLFPDHTNLSVRFQKSGITNYSQGSQSSELIGEHRRIFSWEAEGTVGVLNRGFLLKICLWS